MNRVAAVTVNWGVEWRTVNLDVQMRYEEDAADHSVYVCTAKTLGQNRGWGGGR
jgi:hypothetical protein